MGNDSIANQSNPYIIGRPIYEPEHFFGREDLFSFVQDNLIQQSQVILLHGRRRIGKSSVLAHIPNFVKLENFVFVNLSLEGRSRKSLSDLLYELAVDIKEYLEDDLELSVEQIIIPDKQAFRDDREIFTRKFLPQVYQVINDKNIVLLIDEFDVLSESSQDTATEHFFSYLKSIIYKQDRLFIIPVIGRQLDDLPNLLKIFHQAPNKNIGLLQKENAIKLITNPTQDILTYEDNAIDKILELSAGHPYFTQVICFAIFSQAREENRTIVKVADVETIVDRAIEIGEAGLVWFRNGLSVHERVFLSAVAEIQNQQSKSNTRDPLKLLKDKDVLITKSLQDAGKKLIEGEFLSKSKKYPYYITIGLVRLWLTKRYTLPQAIEELEKLYEYILTLGKIEFVPGSITKFFNLTKLDLSDNQLKTIPESIVDFSNLTRLDLSNNQLKTIPDSLGDFANLTELDLEKNQLLNLPESLGKTSNLTDLNLSNNQLTNLPNSIGKFSNLRNLQIGNNQLTNLPESLGNLSRLTWINLEGNQLTNLPESLGNLSRLTWINLEGNQLTNLPESIGNLSSLFRINLEGNQLTNLPESIGNLSNLTEVVLSNNQLTNLPESIGNLSSLFRINLEGNQLTNLPKSIGNLSSLTELDLGSNQLKGLPESIGNLSRLTWINLGKNQLINLPESIGSLSNLTRIYLHENQLTNLPQSIGNLSSLIELDLWYNHLKSLPQSIGSLSRLTWINLGKNQLINLPESISKFSNLTEINLLDNPLDIPPTEVANKGIQAIQEYFRQLSKEGEDYIYEAKLLIVGEAGAGKTSLAKKIQNPLYQLQKNLPSTEGINVIKWRFPLLDKEREFTVNIWDFGGQEIYHATHQFFLTKRSLYALVADIRKEDTDFYYWLNIVELLSNNSPLLIIKNEIQDRKREINERALRGRFTNLKETLTTNLATNRGLDEIMTNIKYYIQNLPHIGQALPKTWVKVRQALEEDKRNYISLQEYLDICETNGFTREEDKLQLSGYLHDLGVCLHFQDDEDSLLYRTVILKPEWGTDAVYKVLDNKQVIDNKGCFTRKDLTSIWQEEKYTSMRGELLELMKKFQLCYEIPDRKDTLIAPQLLSNNQPEYDWNESNNLIVRYAYSDFMPKGIISRFIVIMHQYIDQQKYVWKTGVILNKDNTKAEVIEDYGKREIKIRIAGTYKRELLNKVTYELDRIHDSYNRLKYIKLIPCNCHQCKDSQSPHFYSFQILRQFLADKQYKIQCQKSYQMVNVLSLIDDVVDLGQLIKEEEIENDQEKEVLREIVRIQANRTIKAETKAVPSGEDTYNQEKVGIGHISGGTIEKGAKVAGIMNKAEQKNLAEAAADIQALLKQLEETYPTNTFSGKVAIASEAIQRIDNDPKLAPRILSALKAGGTSALDSLLNHPAASFVIAALEDWQQTQSS